MTDLKENISSQTSSCLELSLGIGKYLLGILSTCLKEEIGRKLVKARKIGKAREGNEDKVVTEENKGNEYRGGREQRERSQGRK